MLAYALTLGGSQSNPAPPEAYFNFIVAQPILGKKCDKEEGIHGIRARQSLDAILRFWGTTLWGKRKKKATSPSLPRNVQEICRNTQETFSI